MRIADFVPLDGKTISLEIKVNSPIPIKRKSVPFLSSSSLDPPFGAPRLGFLFVWSRPHCLYPQDFLNGTFFRIDQLDFI